MEIARTLENEYDFNNEIKTKKEMEKLKMIREI